MDFSLSEEQEATRDLARQILTDRETHEHLKELEAGGEGFDRDTWAELAKAGLLGIALPEDAGGSGLGFVALCRLFEEIGRTVAPVPVLPTVVLGALPIAQFGTDAQKQQYLPGVVVGDTVLTAALVETGTDALHPTATFQAVGQRAADAYIDTEAIRLTALQAAWRLEEGLPAATEVAVAKFWAADGGQRVVHAAQHLHGGIGVDRDYPLHRYFLWAKELELTLGGATPQLLKLGEILAAEPV